MSDAPTSRGDVLDAGPDRRAGAVARFWWWVAGILAVAIGVRLAYTAGSTVPSQEGWLVNFDPIYYHRQALAVADGQGFTNPAVPGTSPGADHPPILVVVLALASVVGIDQWGAHRAITAVIGALVVPLLAVLGRRLAGPRAGLLAAVLGAASPALWANDGQLMPEPIYSVAVAGALVLAHQLWDGDTRFGRLPHAAALGAVIGLSALARGEGLFLLGFTVLPLALWGPARGTWRQRLAVVLVAGVACGAVLAPWAIYNARRFTHPVLLSTSGDTALAGATCDITWQGERTGSWTPECFAAHQSGEALESSEHAAELRSGSIEYIRDHVADVPRVVATRIARMWGVYRTTGMVDLDALQNRPRSVAWAGLVSVFVLAPLSAVGALRLRRAGRPALLLVAMPLMVTAVAAVFYGNQRFRIPADLAFVTLAAVAVEGWWRRAASVPSDRG